jgi:hypothetical protein
MDIAPRRKAVATKRIANTHLMGEGTSVKNQKDKRKCYREAIRTAYDMFVIADMKAKKEATECLESSRPLAHSGSYFGANTRKEKKNSNRKNTKEQVEPRGLSNAFI